MKNRTLEEIIKAEQANRYEGGQFGINACKDSIRFLVEHLGSNLADLLNEYVERANTDVFFNKAMVLACWELMQEEETMTATKEEQTAEKEGKTMKNYIGRRGAEADRINAVIEAYEATRDGKTADTVARLVESLGRDGAAVAVATVVNAVSLHDGRISDRVRKWAQGVEGAPNNEELRAVGICGVDSWIHSAHVDNLGAAVRRWLRDNPQPEIIEEEPTEEASADPVEVFNEAHNSIIEDKSGNRSAWGRGVTAYALELLDNIEEAIKGGWLPLDELETAKGRKAAMLNGASDWEQYSWGGCSLIYDYEIAERLCTPSELKRTRGGELRPNASEEWLDTQARALNQAANRASRALRQALERRA